MVSGFKIGGSPFRRGNNWLQTLVEVRQEEPESASLLLSGEIINWKPK